MLGGTGNQLAGDARGGQGETENRWWRDRASRSSRDGRTTRRQTRWIRWGLGGSGVLVMFRRGDGDGDGKRSRKVGQLLAARPWAGWLVCWLRVWLVDAKRQKDRAERGRPWFSSFSGSQCPGPRRPREAKPEGGGDAAFDSRPCRPSAEKEGPAFNPTSLPANPVPFLLGLRVATPETSAPSDKDTTCGHPIISTKAGPVCQRGCNLISIYRISIAAISGGGKITKEKATP